jgi:hypothetical protein
MRIYQHEKDYLVVTDTMILRLLHNGRLANDEWLVARVQGKKWTPPSAWKELWKTDDDLGF